jgi:HK97 family phage major capsid protein
MDWTNFTSYAQTEMTRQLIDVENAELLNGSGTGGNLTGFLNTSGILTHNFATDPAGTTSLDAVELSIAQLRVGTALAEPDLLVLHPSTWAAMRRTKSTTGEYIVQPDPTRGAVNTLWGLPVLVTTQLAAGAGLLLDTTKFGKVLVREGITVKTGTDNDDFSRNITRFVIEERLTLTVERPSAVLAIAGLPLS